MDIRLILQCIGAVVISSISAYVLDPNSLDAPSGNIVSALSIINAAIFPTVVLSATILKGGTLSKALVARYRCALRTQISFFFGILLFSLMAIGAIVLAQAVGWKFIINASRFDIKIDLSWIFNFVIVFLGSFVAFRLSAFFQAIVSLLDIHIDGVLEEVAARKKQSEAEREKELAELPDVSAHQLPPEERPLGF